MQWHMWMVSRRLSGEDDSANASYQMQHLSRRVPRCGKAGKSVAVGMVLTVSIVCIWHDPLMELANIIQKPVESDSISTHVTYNTVWYLSQVLCSVDYLIGRSTVEWSYLSAVYWIALRPLWILMGILVTILDVHRIFTTDNDFVKARRCFTILFIDMPIWQPPMRDFLFH